MQLITKILINSIDETQRTQYVLEAHKRQISGLQGWRVKSRHNTCQRRKTSPTNRHDK